MDLLDNMTLDGIYWGKLPPSPIKVLHVHQIPQELGPLGGDGTASLDPYADKELRTKTEFIPGLFPVSEIFHHIYTSGLCALTRRIPKASQMAVKPDPVELESEKERLQVLQCLFFGFVFQRRDCFGKFF